MESQSLRTVVRRLREAVAPTVPHGRRDTDLVQAFVGRRDPLAFEQIVRRHGPMVLGVCRRVLRDPADADDAFQATFLVLLRRAGSLREPDRLAGWLHQVAHRTARKLRSLRLARAARQTELFDVAIAEPPAELVWRELRPIFDQELDRLPQKLRLPAVLCLLEGHSKGEAARTLGWPEGTLSGRLQQARERLRLRFAARGLTLSTGALAAALFEGVGSAAVTDRLLTSTTQLANGPAGATASAAVCTLADGVSHAMFMTKAKALAAVVLAAGVIGTGTGVVLVPGAGPGDIVAGEPVKGGAKDAGPGTKEPKSYDFKEGRKNLDRTIVDLTLAELQSRSDAQKNEAARDRAREHFLAALAIHIQSLRDENERIASLLAKGLVGKQEAEAVQAELRAAEDQLAKFKANTAKDPDRAALVAELEALKERASFEERLVKKGFMTRTQLEATKSKIAQLETDLAKLDAPKAPDPRRAAMENLIRKMEEIVEKTQVGVNNGIVPQQELLNAQRALLEYKFRLAELKDRPVLEAPKGPDLRRAALEDVVRKMEIIVDKTAEGVRKGIVPQQELLNVQRTLLEHKFKLLDLPERPAAELPRPSPAQHAAIEDLIRKMEEIVQKTAEGVKKGIVPEQELFNAERDLLEYKYRLADLTHRTDSDPRADRKAAIAERLKAEIDQKERELGRAKVLLREQAISQGEVRRLTIELGRLKAAAAEAAADYAAALRHREGVVAESEAQTSETKRLAERNVVSNAELRAAELALAEAKVEALAAGIRRQLAAVVELRDQEVRDARKLFEAKAITSEELRRAEQALAEAKARLAQGR
jgi:RNA polymerase sigma factor (sigma-70 family)